MAQGKAWNKEETLRSLKELFLLGYNRTKACKYAGIPLTTLLTWEEKDESLRVKIDTWIGNPDVIARRNVVSAITDRKDRDMSKWWIEKREKDEFGDKPIDVNVTVGLLLDIPMSDQILDGISTVKSGNTTNQIQPIGKLPAKTKGSGNSTVSPAN